jgi:hypothetical protein
MPTFTPQQTLFTLSLLPGLGHCFSGSVDSIEAALQTQLVTLLPTLQPQIGAWQLVWGPAVFELPTSDRPDNVMMVVSNVGGEPGLPGLVVAIAGTNPYSVLDWIVEDFLVTNQVPWPTGSPAGHPMISLATFNGLSVLQSLTPGAGQPGAGLTVRGFLATQVSAPIAINVGGHSLGGALSPTLALWLSDTRATWDPASHATLSVLPSAGPTAGNQDFAAYSDSQIGAGVTRLHNSLDVVPHAWVGAALQAVPDLYAPQIQPDAVVQGFADLALFISQGGDYAQINAGAPALAGTVNTGLINASDLPFINFFRQAGFQHVDAYYDLLGVPSLHQILACVQASAPAPLETLARMQVKLAKFRLAQLHL